jgi:hypothetical protein
MTELKEHYEGGRWIKLAQDRVPLRVSVLAVFNRVQLQKNNRLI